MGLTTYHSGDCGSSYYSSIMIVNLLVVMAFLPLMILMLTWLTTAGGASALLYPIVLGNAFNVPWWVVGFVALIPGTMAAYTSSHGKRVVLMNVWVMSLLLFSLLTLAAGCSWVYRVYADRELLNKLWTSFTDNAPQQNQSKVRTALGDLGGRVVDFTTQALSYELYSRLPYPYSAIFFLYWQKGVSVITFAVLPGLLSGWATLHALGNRNYFAKHPELYNDVSLAQGTADVYSSDEDDSDEVSESESQPLQRNKARRERLTSQNTIVQEDGHKARNHVRAV